ncbi:hypothetical protein GTK09_23625 [Jiella sp. 40Bstr34]|uniref:Uncharacterized protein n=1 Tax=Jiella pacifica TaxID=2696469 RepID=A0A6N9T863_9HYPH|nr:hypothetical protein [Jiella pacifica]
MTYDLTTEAESDFYDIYAEGALRFGQGQAETVVREESSSSGVGGLTGAE